MRAILSHQAFDVFRDEWVKGHLDHQRAIDALEAACAIEQDLQRVFGGAAVDGEAYRRARAAVDEARRRLERVELLLGQQFDRFCGLRPAPGR